MAMIYLVDGHNLIPKVPGLSLTADDDEMQLVEVLQNFARVRRKKVEVYFDRAAIGKQGVRKFGTISAHFVHQGGSADQAIRQRLEKSARQNQNYCVVSSDLAVREYARIYHAHYQSAETFAAEIIAAAREESTRSPEQHIPMTEEETREWLRLFNQSGD